MECISRSECIRRIREELLAKAVGDEELSCDIAARHGIFCRGFDRFPTPLLRKRFAWLVHGEGGIVREELLERIRRWIQARQFATGQPTACDVMSHEGDLCFGWDSFGNDKLEATYLELFHTPVRVIDDPHAQAKSLSV